MQLPNKEIWTELDLAIALGRVRIGILISFQAVERAVDWKMAGRGESNPAQRDCQGNLQGSQ